MGTRCSIGLQHEDGTIEYVCCSYDGDLAYNTLKACYTTLARVQELIKFGDMSTLGGNIHPTDKTHSWNKPQDNVCVYYARDRGEDFDNCMPFTCKNTAAYKKNLKAFDYNYLFKNGKWTHGNR